MDSFHFDSYISSPFSGSSAPRTPSPQTSISSDGAPSPAHFKLELEPVCSIFSDQMLEDHAVPPEGHSLWQGLSHQSLPFNGSRGSLLGELYDHDLPVDRPAHVYDQPNDAGEWHSQLSRQAPHHPSQESAAMRRATYPYVRQDRDASAPYSQSSFMPQDCEPHHSPYPRSDSTLYGEPLPLIDNSPQLISFGQDNHSFHPGYDMSVSSSPASSYVEFDNLDHHVKLEESAPVIVPSQTCLYRPPSSGGMHAMSYLPSHAGLPVQHTDDAASKETQYLRRRCFNCSQTEPPSWRRSTLNPGKIVCNKCGLYERTHLRPRPLRFDELRTGNKSRKQSKSITGTPASKLIKKEIESQAMSRRASVSSSSSSIHSSSDWDDSVSVYSSGSASTSSFNSPAVTSFSLPLERSSQSPPLGARDGGIRLPNAPLSDIASLQSVPASPRKAATSPDYSLASVIQGDYHARRTSLPVDLPKAPSVEVPEITGWQAVPMGGSPPNKSTKSSALRKAVAA